MPSLFEPLRERARALPPTRTAVVYPMSPDSLAAAVAAADSGLIVPVLVGPQAAIVEALASQDVAADRFEIVDSGDDPGAAARRSATLARDRAVDALMKGSLHTHDYLSAIVSHESGLRTQRRLSHVFVFGFDRYPKLLALTDAAVNVAPDLVAKADIAQNAIDLCRALGVQTPKVAILAATEAVNAQMSATLDAAALSKMTDRGQIRNAIVDGPLAFDNAISARAAQVKGVVSPVAGDADVLLVPDVQCGNALYKQAAYFTGAELGGLVVGAAVPVLLTSRADTVQVRIDSCVIANLYAHWVAEGNHDRR